ncbi:2,3-dihydro-2,3-dihydroxybenzoate dehydrogenase [Azospirillum doebereinerae]|nr:2,3-dihydro-2,3-dihydroxybenzoate dehydrogenase [Azospirillum doebereinerae]
MATLTMTDHTTAQAFLGQTVWVTGVNQGIGLAVAETFTAQGAEVIGFDLRHDETVERPFRRLALDVTDAEAVARTCEELFAAGTGIDALVNVAGILRLGALETLGLDDWQQSFAVNAAGPFHLMRAVVPVLKRQGKGCIVSVSSNAAHVPRARMAVYGASKAALTSLTMTAGLELAPFGIRCNVVSPGSTDTPMLRGMWSDADGAARTIAGNHAQHRIGIPLGKLATPQDIANTVVFLASPAAGHITMMDVLVDGGATLGK